MNTKGSGRRVLRFAVTGALLGGGGLGCDPAKDGAKAPTVDAKTGDKAKPVADGGEPPPEDGPRINPGPEEPGGDAGVPGDDGTPTDPVEIEDRVNTQHVEDPAVPDPVVPKPLVEENVNTRKVEEPEPEPKEPRYVNTVKEIEPTPVPEEKPQVKTNTGRVQEPKARKAPKAP